MNDPANFDESALARLRELGGAEFAGDMVRMFHEYANGQLAQARTALQANDIAGVEKAIHPLKTSAAHVGAVAMKGLCQEIEKFGREGDAEPMPALLERLEAAYAAVRPLLVVPDPMSGV